MSDRQHLFSAAVVVAALGYFVDVYDLVLFLVVKNPSLTDLGIAPEGLLESGTFLLNCQNGGMLLGGIAWGILGDRIGRTKVLFGSILTYSLANFLNAFTDSLSVYALLRLLAGFGLAGELGAGITLVAELIPQRLRGYGSTIIAAVGVLGAVAAGLTGDLLSWRTTYMIGGSLGLLLLFLRVSVAESRLFQGVVERGSSTKAIVRLLVSPSRIIKLMKCIALGVPIWYIIGILLANSRDLSVALGVPEMPRPGIAIAICYSGIFIGDILGGVLSQRLQSRKRATGVFLALSTAMPVWFLTSSNLSLLQFYAMLFGLGFAAGYWVLVVTMAAEQFGTNIRATVTTSVPNFIRGAVVPVSALFLYLKPSLGLLDAALYVGLGLAVLAGLSLASLEETFARDLDFIEE